MAQDIKQLIQQYLKHTKLNNTMPNIDDFIIWC